MRLNRLVLDAGNSVRITMLPEGRVCVELEDVRPDVVPSGPQDLIFDVLDVAELLKTTQRHVRNLMHREKNPLPFYKLGRKVRFREADIQQWMKAAPDNLARKFIKELKAA
jgi:excisionase family DNA binding protein